MKPVKIGDVDVCVEPIVDAGQALMVDDAYVLSDELSLVPTPGHSPGHVCVDLKSRGERALFTGDLIIGADGIRSSVRAQIMPDAQPLYAGYIAWRGLIAESSLPAALHRDIFAHNMVCYPDGDAMTMYAVPGPSNDVRPGHRAYNWVWYHPVGGEGLSALCTDASIYLAVAS